jgi:hypothetical chaperone protein
MRRAEDLRVDYSDSGMHQRLMKVLNERLGHRIASEVEAAKIRTSVSDAPTSIDLAFIENGLAPALSASDTAGDLDALLRDVVACGHECVRRAGLKAGALDGLYLTGGSSALRPFQHLLQREFPQSEMIVGDLFGGVAAGLAYAGSLRG